MRNAETVLGIIRERGNHGLPVEQVYRQLFNPELYVRAYGKIARNRGAMTAGTTAETIDGMTRRKIDAIIDDLRRERYRWTPVRRVNIPKSNGKTRPLGVPVWKDKLLQEVIRAILESYYEPQFSRHSHGFRPGRGCHTALQEVRDEWRGTVWLIEGDIQQCFDRLNHQVMLHMLAETIHDGRFIRLIGNMLTAGYVEDWRFHKTLSGTPQGGVVSPILANIYLDRLDRYVESTLLPLYNRGKKRKINREYHRLSGRVRYARRMGRFAQAEEVRKQTQKLPAGDPNDPTYRRLRFVRYADDFLLGFTGPYVEAEEIKRLLGEFLLTIKLELSESKTLITHARTESARFLGYDIGVYQCDSKLDDRRRRSINAMIGLRVPAEVVQKHCAPYMRNNKPVKRPERLFDTPYSIVAQYQAEYRGLVEYYRLAINLRVLGKVNWVMGSSLLQTLSEKLRLSVNQVAKRHRTIIQTPQGPRKVLQVIVPRGEDKKPLVTHWGGITLKWERHAVLNDQPRKGWNVGTELVQRLMADKCELCGSRENVEVHHIRALKALRPYRNQGSNKPEWVKIMATRHRKTLVVCHKCHVNIHNGGNPKVKSHES